MWNAGNWPENALNLEHGKTEIGPETQRFAIAAQCFRARSEARIHVTQVDPRFGVVSTQSQCALQKWTRLHVASLLDEHRAKVVVRDGMTGIHRDRFPIAGLGLRAIPQTHQRERALHPGVGIVRLPRERLVEGRDRTVEIKLGGEAIAEVAGRPGFYLQPALFFDTDNGMRINREEIFGPIASVIRARDADEALMLANDTDYGLSSGVCTTTLKLAAHFKRHLQAGMVMVNAPTAGVDPHVPFGGRKASSYGPREQGRYAAEFYTTVKTTYVNA